MNLVQQLRLQSTEDVLPVAFLTDRAVSRTVFHTDIGVGVSCSRCGANKAFVLHQIFSQETAPTPHAALKQNMIR